MAFAASPSVFQGHLLPLRGVSTQTDHFQFSNQKLVEFLSALGNDVDIVVSKRSKRSGLGRIQVRSEPAWGAR